MVRFLMIFFFLKALIFGAQLLVDSIAFREQNIAMKELTWPPLRAFYRAVILNAVALERLR